MLNGPIPDRKTCSLFRTLALEAGRRILEIRASRNYDLRQKPDGSPVTAADHAADDVIAEGLAQAFPDVAVVSEERPPPERDPQAPFFLVDPLDGTKSFLAGNDSFTVNIALIRDGRPVAGILFAPSLRRCYATTHTGAAVVEQWDGTFQSSELLGLDARPPTRHRNTALVSHVHLDDRTVAWLARHSIDQRRPMGSSLKFGLLAEGAAAVYPRLSPIWEWDIAAGHAILAAAGGSVRDLEGEPLEYGQPEYRTKAFIACARGPEPSLR